MGDRLKIVLDLVRKGAITDEQAQVLLEKETQYVYYPRTYGYWPWVYPYHQQPIVSYSTGTFNGLAQSASTLTINNSDYHGGILTTTCGCPGDEENSCCNQKTA